MSNWKAVTSVHITWETSLQEFSPFCHPTSFLPRTLKIHLCLTFVCIFFYIYHFYIILSVKKKGEKNLHQLRKHTSMQKNAHIILLTDHPASYLNFNFCATSTPVLLSSSILYATLCSSHSMLQQFLQKKWNVSLSNSTELHSRQV